MWKNLNEKKNIARATNADAQTWRISVVVNGV